MSTYIYVILYIVSIGISIWFLAFLLKNNRHNAVVRAMILTVAIAIGWIVIDFLTLFSIFSDNIHILIWRLGFLTGLVSILFLFRFVLIFTQISIFTWLKWFISIIILLTGYLILFTDYIIVGLRPLQFVGDSNYIPGSHFIFIVALMIFVLFLSFYYVLRKLIVSKDKKEKTQLKYLVAGLLAPLILASVTNLILPLIGVEFPRLAAIAIVILILFFGYAIYRWDALNIHTGVFKIRTKISVTFIVIYLVVMVIIGFAMQSINSNVISDGIHSHLQTTVQSRAHSVNIFLEEQKDKIAIAATHKELSNEELRTINNSNDEFYEVFVLDSQGMIIASSDESSVGLDRSLDDYFINGKNETYIKDAYFSKTTNSPSIAVSTPHAGGVLVGRIDLVVLNEITRDKTGLGETGEAYLINREGYAISSLLFKEDTFLEFKIETENAKNCLMMLEQEEKMRVMHVQHDPSGIAQDYRSLNVLGAYHPIHSMNWCLLAEIDEKEAMAPTIKVLRIFIIVVVGSLLIYLLAAIWVSRKITKPIEKLHQGTEIIKGDNLDHKVGTDSQDEIGQLSRAFDEMTGAIKKSRIEVDKKVEEQTKDIIEKSRDLENQQKATLNILEDVEEEKKKTESLVQDLEKFKLAVENASDHIVITDAEGVVLYANKAVEGITGFSIEEILGKKAGTKEFWGGLMDKSVYQKLWKTIKEDKQVFQGKLNNKRKNGEQYIAMASISPILDKNDEVLFFIGIERDITKEDQIDKAKTEFVSLASHQLRTPLSAINWYAEMLLAGDAGELNDEQRQYLDEVYKGNQRMVDLVNSLLNVSRIELGTLAIEPEPVNFIHLSDSVLNELKSKIKEKKLKIIKNYNQNIPEVSADPKLMRIVFQNLLSNAVKYTPENGKINISVDKDENNILIQVKDSGYGIPKMQQDKIFTKLFRADNVREKDTEGTGLGLYIVKAIIDSAQGKVWFESQEKKGTTFYIDMPIAGMKKKEGSKGLNYTK